MGFHQAGFEVVGVDIEPQPNYPFKFIQMDVLELDPSHIRRAFAAVAASPPCQFHTILSRMNGGPKQHLNLIPGVRMLLEETGLPYTIENVEGARGFLRVPICLCGSSFGLRVRRHRLFEANWDLEGKPCEHDWQDDHRPYPRRVSKNRGEVLWSGIIPVHGTAQLHSSHTKDEYRLASVAMGIDWMTKPELNQAIPPAYTNFIGRQLMEVL